MAGARLVQGCAEDKTAVLSGVGDGLRAVLHQRLVGLLHRFQSQN